MSSGALAATACADFETTGLKNLEEYGKVNVWLWSLVSLEEDGPQLYGRDIDSFIEAVYDNNFSTCWFHNIRFDGSFLIDHFIRDLDWEHGREFSTIIDGLGNWFEVALLDRKGKKKVRFWDSVKKFPGQSVNDVANMFGIPGKLEAPFFDALRPPGYEPTEEEIAYCLQDSRIMAHAMRYSYLNGRKGMTLSSDAFHGVKEMLNEGGYWLKWRKWMPALSPELDAWTRLGYKGGWVFCHRPGVFEGYPWVYVYDVNSLYPYVMHDMPLPFGMPYRRLRPRPGELYMIDVWCDFSLKEKHLPTLQVKGNPLYLATEYLRESKEPTRLVMTSVDWELFNEHYDVELMTEPKYMCFKSKRGLLAPYIDRWMEEKIAASKAHDGARRYISKRFLNSPYGKTGMRPDRINKVPFLDEEGDITMIGLEESAEPVYVPYAAFCTSWARSITIRAAQRNYDNFIYADTDSIHLIGDADGIDVDDNALGAWKLEGKFYGGKYLRAKTYLHFDEDHHVEDVKCAGMPDNIKAKVTIDNFRIGGLFDGKLMQRRVPGGVVLVDSTFEIKETLTNKGWLA